MIIILSAPSCSGKTQMARALMKRYQMPFTMMDNLKMAMFRSNPKCGFHPEDSVEDIGNILWPFIREMIKTSIENEQDMILEGCYVLPEYLRDLEAEYKDHILPVFFGFSENYLNHNFESGLLAYRSVVEKRDYPEDRPLSTFIEAHKALRTLCEKEKMTYFEIQEDYEEISTIYDYIEEGMRRQGWH